LYASLKIIRVIKPRRIRWAGHIARIRDDKSLKIMVGNQKGRLGRAKS